MGTQNPAGKHFCIGMTCGGVYYGKRLFVSVYSFRFTVFGLQFSFYKEKHPYFPKLYGTFSKRNCTITVPNDWMFRLPYPGDNGNLFFPGTLPVESFSHFFKDGRVLQPVVYIFHIYPVVCPIRLSKSFFYSLQFFPIHQTSMQSPLFVFITGIPAGNGRPRIPSMSE